MTRQTIINVIEQIARLGYDNTQYSVVTTEVNAAKHYGATNSDKELKPHIAVWVQKEDLKTWFVTAPWDTTLFTEDGDIIAIFNF